jgi:hypothetical protein
VIIHGGDIGSGAHANFADGGRLIAAIGEYVLGDFQQFLASRVGSSRLAITPGRLGFSPCVIAAHFKH